MNAADVARFERAKRAYKAAQPNEAEVQTGVRRARLSLGRSKPRHAWFSKGLVFVALAIGSLAYAKPYALSELVENVLPRGDAGGAKRGVGAATLSLPPETPTNSASAMVKRDVSRAAKVNGAPDPNAQGANGTSAVNPSARAGREAAAASQATRAKKPKPSRSSTAVTPPAELPTPDAAEAVSDWGRVGQAMAKGDETQALAALAELSESDDQRTRDKADVGRAQLLMAHGDRDKACSLARSLTNRRAGGRIERQAQALLKSCTR